MNYCGEGKEFWFFWAIGLAAICAVFYEILDRNNGSEGFKNILGVIFLACLIAAGSLVIMDLPGFMGSLGCVFRDIVH